MVKVRSVTSWTSPVRPLLLVVVDEEWADLEGGGLVGPGVGGRVGLGVGDPSDLTESDGVDFGDCGEELAR